TSVITLPSTDGTTRNGMNRAVAYNGNSQPPSYTMPYAANIGTAINTTIQLELISVSSSFAEYSRNQSVGAPTSTSRSFAKKNDDNAVITFDSNSKLRKAIRIRPSNLPARSGPISWTPRKY